MSSTTMPASHFGWQGESLHYVVRAKGATQLRPPAKLEGMDVRITDVRHEADGLVAQVDVAVTGPVFY